MLAYVLALAVALGSIALYLTAFVFPALHRKHDMIWSGVGLFYALVLWVCSSRITGAVLLGQTASVALLGWFGWQTLSLRWAQTTPHPDSSLPQVSAALSSLMAWLNDTEGDGLVAQAKGKLVGLISQISTQPTVNSGTETASPAVASKLALPPFVTQLWQKVLPAIAIFKARFNSSTATPEPQAPTEPKEVYVRKKFRNTVPPAQPPVAREDDFETVDTTAEAGPITEGIVSRVAEAELDASPADPVENIKTTSDVNPEVPAESVAGAEPKIEPQPTVEPEAITDAEEAKPASEVEESVVLEQPVTEVEQPVTEAEQPVTEVEQPVTEVEQPVTEAEQPVTEAEQPVTEAEQPVNEAEQPVTEVEQPVTEVEQPVTEVEQPVTEVEQPVTEAEQPVTEAEQPITEAEQPITEAEESVNEAEESVSEAKESVSEVEEPVNETEESVNEAEESVNEAEEPVNEAEEPVSETEEPVSEAKESVSEVEEPVNAAEESISAAEESVSAAEEPIPTAEEPLRSASNVVQSEADSQGESASEISSPIPESTPSDAETVAPEAQSEAEAPTTVVTTDSEVIVEKELPYERLDQDFLNQCEQATVQIIEASQQQAASYGSTAIRPQDILLGFLCVDNSHLAFAKTAEISLPATHEIVEQLFGKDDDFGIVVGELCLTKSARKILDAALAESKAHHREALEPAQLLLTLLQSPDPDLRRVLEALNAKVSEMCERLQNELDSSQG